MEDDELDDKLSEGLQEKIANRATAFGQASVYSLSNDYLTTKQKAHVEAVYQAPMGAFSYVFLGYLAFIGLDDFKTAAIYALSTNLVLGLLLWYGASRAIPPYGFFFFSEA